MTSTSQPNQELTHVRADGSAHMVDVTEKSVTTRTALAEATVRTREDVIAMILTPTCQGRRTARRTRRRHYGC